MCDALQYAPQIGNDRKRACEPVCLGGCAPCEMQELSMFRKDGCRELLIKAVTAAENLPEVRRPHDVAVSMNPLMSDTAIGGEERTFTTWNIVFVTESPRTCYFHTCSLVGRCQRDHTSSSVSFPSLLTDVAPPSASYLRCANH